MLHFAFVENPSFGVVYGPSIRGPVSNVGWSYLGKSAIARMNYNCANRSRLWQSLLTLLSCTSI